MSNALSTYEVRNFVTNLIRKKKKKEEKIRIRFNIVEAILFMKRKNTVFAFSCWSAGSEPSTAESWKGFIVYAGRCLKTGDVYIQQDKG